jgi:hypothetical protein
MIIGIAGRARSGKSTLGRALASKLGFKETAYADQLKKLAALFLGFDGSFADPNYVQTWESVKTQQLLRTYFGSRTENWTGREILQHLGMAARQAFGSNFWTERCLAACLATPACEACDGSGELYSAVMTLTCKACGGAGRLPSNFVITDVRFPNEVHAIHDVGGKVIRLNRAESLETRHDYQEGDPRVLNCSVCGWSPWAHPASRSPDQHSSETALPDVSNDLIKYDAEFTGEYTANAYAALEAVRGWLSQGGDT